MTELDYQPLRIVLCEEIITDETNKIITGTIPAFAQPKLHLFRNNRSYRAGLEIIDQDPQLEIIKVYDLDLSDCLAYNGDGSIHTVYAHELLRKFMPMVLYIAFEAFTVPRIKNWYDLQKKTTQDRNNYLKKVSQKMKKNLEKELCYISRDLGLNIA